MATDVSARILHKISLFPCAGIILALFSGVIFATASVIVKLVPNVNPLEIIVCRGCVQMIVFLPMIWINRMPIFGAPGERITLIARGFGGSLDLLTGYAALRMLPLSDAMTIIFSSPVFVYIFACIFLKEEFGVFQILTVLVTVGGVLLISKPTFIFGSTFQQDELVTFSGTRTMGTVLSIVSCIAQAFTYILIRKLKKSPTIVVVNSYSVASIISAVAVIAIIRNCFSEESGDFGKGIVVPSTWQEIALMICNGLCGALGQLCLCAALKIEEASLVSLARTVDIVMAFVYQIILLPHEMVHYTSVIGAIIVTASVSISTLRRWLSEKPGKWDTFWNIINCGMRQDRKHAHSDIDQNNEK